MLSTKLLGKHQDVKLKSITIIHSATTETVRLPPDGDAGLTVHPPAVRTKLPIHRKVREKKLHTKVTPRKKIKSKQPQESKNKESGTTTKGDAEVNANKRSTIPLQSQEQKKPETVRTQISSKIISKSKDTKVKSSVELGRTRKTSKDKQSIADRQKAANKYQKQKSVEESCKAVTADSSAKLLPGIDQTKKSESDCPKTNSKSEPCVPLSMSEEEPIYENIDNISKHEESEESEKKTKTTRLKRSNRILTEVSEPIKNLKDDTEEKKKTKSPSKVISKKHVSSKASPKKKKVKNEVIEYNNEDSQVNGTKATSIPSEDPLGKVQNWLMHSISMGKTSENFGIMTLTLPKSKSSPVGFSSNSKSSDHQPKLVGPPKIVHKNDKVVQIPKLTQKRSRSTGNLRKPEKKDEKMKLQVVYKPPFKFSVKLRKNRVLGTVGTKILKEKSNYLNRQNAGNACEKIQRTAVLVRSSKRNSKQKQEKKTKHLPQASKTPDKENSTENPFTFPSGVAPMSVTSVNSKQLPIYLTDQMDIDSNVHTVPSDLDVLLSESKFLFSDA